MNDFCAVQELGYAKLLSGKPEFIQRSRPTTGARAAGYAYERKVKRKLADLVAERPELQLFVGAWVEFRAEGGPRRWCEIDAYVLNQETKNAICYEVKLRHTPDAWFQLWRLYVPILQQIYPSFRWEGCEIVKWFDAATGFPEPFSLSASPFAIPRRGRTAVHIWNPSREL